MGDRYTGGNLTWRDMNTLEWGETGPSADVSLLFRYITEPIDMTDPTSVPNVFPSRFHDIIIVSGCILAKEDADEKAPSDWSRQRKEWREQLYKALSATRPLITGPRMTQHNPAES